MAKSTPPKNLELVIDIRLLVIMVMPHVVDKHYTGRMGTGVLPERQVTLTPLAEGRHPPPSPGGKDRRKNTGKSPTETCNPTVQVGGGSVRQAA